ncbi:hypothetical protein H920_11977 [Fukomys damarensis]|uniref:Uncharacterized protein n=1 Tax=Fukomys damarensis TaxID=885580 RepID=A0A091D7W4_FUKDA|nr:hypothetical protein H920_11977 [Fukomys damarensis]
MTERLSCERYLDNSLSTGEKEVSRTRGAVMGTGCQRRPSEGLALCKGKGVEKETLSLRLGKALEELGIQTVVGQILERDIVENKLKSLVVVMPALGNALVLVDQPGAPSDLEFWTDAFLGVFFSPFPLWNVGLLLELPPLTTADGHLRQGTKEMGPSCSEFLSVMNDYGQLRQLAMPTGARPLVLGQPTSLWLAGQPAACFPA